MPKNIFAIRFIIIQVIKFLFYNDDEIHKIYVSKGQFDLEKLLLIFIYSTIISIILNSPIF